MTTLTRRAQAARLQITEPPHFSWGAMFAVGICLAVCVMAIRCSSETRHYTTVKPGEMGQVLVSKDALGTPGWGWP